MVLYRHHIDQIQKEFFTCSRLFTNKKAMKFLDLCYCRLGQNSIFVTVTRKSKRNWPNLVWCSTDTLYTRYKRKFSPTTAHWLIKEDFGFFRILLFALCATVTPLFSLFPVLLLRAYFLCDLISLSSGFFEGARMLHRFPPINCQSVLLQN